MKEDNNKDNLETAIRELLINPEVDFHLQDWNEMEKRLDAQPSEHSFKWNSTLTVVVGILVLVAIYLIFHFVSPDKIAKSEEATPTVNENDVAITTVDSSIFSKKDTTTLQVSPTVNNQDTNLTSQQEIISSKNLIGIDEKNKREEIKEKLPQKDAEISETKPRRSKDKKDSLKTTDPLLKKKSIIANADTVSEHLPDITEDNLSTNEIPDNAESISDAIEKIIEKKMVEEKNLASDSIRQISTPKQGRKLKSKKRK